MIRFSLSTIWKTQLEVQVLGGGAVALPGQPKGGFVRLHIRRGRRRRRRNGGYRRAVPAGHPHRTMPSIRLRLCTDLNGPGTARLLS